MKYNLLYFGCIVALAAIVYAMFSKRCACEGFDVSIPPTNPSLSWLSTNATVLGTFLNTGPDCSPTSICFPTPLNDWTGFYYGTVDSQTGANINIEPITTALTDRFVTLYIVSVTNQTLDFMCDLRGQSNPNNYPTVKLTKPSYFPKDSVTYNNPIAGNTYTIYYYISTVSSFKFSHTDYTEWSVVSSSSGVPLYAVVSVGGGNAVQITDLSGYPVSTVTVNGQTIDLKKQPAFLMSALVYPGRLSAVDFPSISPLTDGLTKSQPYTSIAEMQASIIQNSGSSPPSLPSPPSASPSPPSASSSPPSASPSASRSPSSSSSSPSRSPSSSSSPSPSSSSSPSSILNYMFTLPARSY